MTKRRVTYFHAARNTIWDYIEAAKATEVLPTSQATQVAAHVGFPIGIEDLNPGLAALFTTPAHVFAQSPELIVETCRMVGEEALKLIPDVARTNAATVAWSGRSI